jgi:hypothetical protein
MDHKDNVDQVANGNGTAGEQNEGRGVTADRYCYYQQVYWAARYKWSSVRSSRNLRSRIRPISHNRRRLPRYYRSATLGSLRSNDSL